PRRAGRGAGPADRAIGGACEVRRRRRDRSRRQRRPRARAGELRGRGRQVAGARLREPAGGLRRTAGGAAPRMGAGPGARRRWPVARRSRRSGETGRGLRIPGMVRTGGIRNRPWEVEMQLGMIGLGRMGANMARRLRRGGHAVVGFDPTPPARAALEDETVATVDSLQALVGALQPPRALWMMVPAGAPVDDTIAALRPLLAPGDVLVDGGNSWYRDSQRRHTALAEAGIAYLDVGTSGGVWGLAEGYSLMVGGDAEP